MENYKGNGYEQKIDKIRELVEKEMPKLPYHNYEHASRVYGAAEKLANESGLGYEDSVALRTAALFHDVILVPGRKDNEERSAEYAKNYLLNVSGYDSEIAEKVSRLILATRMPQKPSDLLEGIICDSDLDNLGCEDFVELGDKVRQEIGIPAGRGWTEGQLKFLKSHQYHTEAARRMKDEGKRRNVEYIEKLLQEVK